MKTIVLVCALAVALLAPMGAAHAQSDALKEAYRQYKALSDQGRYGEAEPFARNALKLSEEEFGPEHQTTANLLNHLALLYKNQGRYVEAEPLYKRSLAINEKIHGPDHHDVGLLLNNLGNLYRVQGRYAEAGPLLKRAVAVSEKAHGLEHHDVSQSLNNLALLYQGQGRYAEAEPLYKRSLAILEKVHGPDNRYVGLSLNNLAGMYWQQGRYAEAEPLYKRSLAINEKALGPDHPDVSLLLNNLGNLYEKLGRYAEAEPFLKRSLAIREKVLGPDHPDVGQSLNNLGYLYKFQGRYAEAEPLYKRSLAIKEKAFGPDHPLVATTLGNLWSLYRIQGRYAEALTLIQRATAIHGERAARAEAGRSGGGGAEQRSVRNYFLNHLYSLDDAVGAGVEARDAATAEAFEVAQLARVTGAAVAVNRMAARFAAGDDALANLVRARQGALDRWRSLDGALLAAVSKLPDERVAAPEQTLREQLVELDADLKRLDNDLTERFPEYAELASPKPLSLANAQKLLGPGEALLTLTVGSEQSFVLAMRHDRAGMYRIEVGADELRAAVAELRHGVDLFGVGRVEDLPRFDTRIAYDLYQKLFGPVEPLLEGARHVFVVPDGALQSLPLGVLVTEEQAAPPSDLAGYRKVPWLAKRYAMTVLPSVSSLRALRVFAARTLARKPFVGFGDPLLEGDGRGPRGVKLASLFRGGAVADVKAVKGLARLPDTADELEAVARTLGAGEVYLRERATETRVKAMSLADFRVVSFATHGLVAGELKGLPEPALVLTPPDEGTEGDDGLLTASEVAQLDLSAEWVVLSACNTAAGGEPGAEGLSGLAKAFFYAGSRALLVSHWPVASASTVKLITGVFAAAAAHPEIGRAEALRRSMLKLMDDPGRPEFAHPAFWAPFVVVGEGGTFTPS